VQVRYYLQHASEVDPTFKYGAMDLIFWACVTGRQVEPEWLDEFARRLERRAFTPGDMLLPDQILRKVMLSPRCLASPDVIRLLVAGASNPRATATTRADFLEAAADYELLVAHDPASARGHLVRALALTPGNASIDGKLKTLGRAGAEIAPQR
jgi:hypothetical protein